MYSSPTRTVQEVIDYVERVYGDESGTSLEKADFLMFINNACSEINSRTRVLKESATVEVVGGTASYSFPNKRILQIEALLFDGQLVRNVTYAHALENYAGQVPTSGTGQPQFWWEFGGRFTLWPTPGEGTIQLDYTVQHAPITTDTTAKLPLPDNYYNDICTRVLEQAYELDEQPQLAEAQREKLAASLNSKMEDATSAQQLFYETITLID